jgi:hypothetical protein
MDTIDLEKLLEKELFYTYDINFNNERPFIEIVNAVKNAILISKTEKIDGKPNLNLCLDIKDNEILKVTNINSYLNNQILRKISRNEVNGGYFLKTINTLEISLKLEPGVLNTFSFFFIYLKQYLTTISKVVMNTYFNQSIIDNEVRLPIYIIFKYILENEKIQNLVLKDQVFCQKGFSIFDVVGRKWNLKSLHLDIPNINIEITDLTKMLTNAKCLEQLILKDIFKINGLKTEFQNLINILLSLESFSDFQFISSNKFFSKKYLEPILAKDQFLQLLFNLQINKDFTTFYIDDLNNIITNEDITHKLKFSEHFYTKLKHKCRMSLICNFEGLINFNFINFHSLQTLDIGLLDITSFKSLIKELKICKLQTLTLRMKSEVTWAKDFMESMKDLFSNQNICKINVLNIKSSQNKINFFSLLSKNTTLREFCVLEHMEIIKSNLAVYKDDNFIFFKFDIKLILALIFSLKAKLSQINKGIRNINILNTISQFLLNEKELKKIYFENFTDLKNLIKKG